MLTFTRLLILESSQTSRPRHLVVTLDPNKFAEKKQQRLHIGGLRKFRLIRLHNQYCLVKSPDLVYGNMNFESGPGKYSNANMPFPPDTKAFLYYSTPPGKPRIAGELRFRVTSSDDPASFESVSDLMKKNGETWSRPLFVLPKYYISSV